MMNKIIFFLFFGLGFSSCTINSDSTSDFYLDRLSRYEYYQSWFNKIESEMRDTIDIKNIVPIIKPYFDSTMTHDIKFVKCLTINPSTFTSDKYRPHIIYSKLINKNETGELKAFLMEIKVEPSNTLYNGEKEVELFYEIQSFIPLKEENHNTPFINGIDECVILNSKTFDGLNINDKILGAYLLKQKK